MGSRLQPVEDGVMRSFARQHKARWAEHRSGSHNLTVPTPQPSGLYGVWCSQVKADWDRLKTEPDHAERDRQKPELVQRYWDEYLQGWIASGETHPNEVLALVLVWAADVPECPVLMPLVEAAVRSGSSIPDYCRFKSDLLTHVSDMVRNRAEQVYKSSQIGVLDGELRPFNLPMDVHQVFGEAINATFAVNFVSLAKYHKLAGLEAESLGRWAAAYNHYVEANKYPNVAVKGRLEKAARQLETLITSPPQQATGSGAEVVGSAPTQLTPLAPGQPVFLDRET